MTTTQPSAHEVLNAEVIPTPYEDLLREILENGNVRGDRTGTGTKSLFARQIRYDLAKGYPLLTTKKVFFKKMATELVWFLKGDTNIKYLLERDVHFWTEWAFKEYLEATNAEIPEVNSAEWATQMKVFEGKILEDVAFAEQYGNLGQVYGAQWRSWKATTGESIDQIADVVEQIRHNAESRRLVVTAWNPEFVPTSALPPCHVLFQFYVSDGRLSCHLYQRSADMFLGVPFNIASYALLTMMIAQQVELEYGELVMTFGDGHIYSNHIEQVEKQLANAPYPYPTLKFLRKPDDISDYDVDDFLVENYVSHERISAPIAV